VHALDQVWEALRKEFDSSCAQIARAARYQLTNELNQLFRRFRHYQDESEWISTLLEGAGRFVQQVGIFTLQDQTLHLRAQAHLSLPSELSFPLTSAAAFATAADTYDPVVALRTAAEVTEHLASSEPSDRCHVIPIVNGQRTVAILFAADQEYMDVNALELITGVASTVLERRSNADLHAQIAPLAASETALPASTTEQETEAQQGVGAVKPGLPAWADLNEEERALHIRAQRFSRVTVAEMQLAKPQGCRAGREQNNLYLFLKPEIEKARETYRKEFMTIPSMVDYLHLELVNTAAEGDEMKLGAEYPGQLV
jgi:hypothetical protein